MSKEQTIQLDCEPGALRPGALIEGVIKDTGLKLKEACSKCFGEWTWDYNDVDPETWKGIQPLLKERVSALYYKGQIRFGSW